MSATAVISIMLSCMAIIIANLRAIKDYMENISLLLSNREEYVMAKKMNNTELMHELMYGIEGEGGMSESQRKILLDATKQFDDGTMNGKECRRIIAHAIIECYQKMDDSVKSAFRPLYKRYMNSNRNMLGEDEESMYVEFMQFIRGEETNI